MLFSITKSEVAPIWNMKTLLKKIATHMGGTRVNQYPPVLYPLDACYDSVVDESQLS